MTPRAFAGGDFVYYFGGFSTPTHVPPARLSGVAVDGAKVVHAGSLYKGSGRSPKLPALEASRKHKLRYDHSEDKWDLLTLQSDGTWLARARYETDDLRLCVVYRARCFASREDALEYRSNIEQQRNQLSLDAVLERLASPAAQPVPPRGRSSGATGLCALPRADGELPAPRVRVPHQLLYAGHTFPRQPTCTQVACGAAVSIEHDLRPFCFSIYYASARTASATGASFAGTWSPALCRSLRVVAQQP